MSRVANLLLQSIKFKTSLFIRWKNKKNPISCKLSRLQLSLNTYIIHKFTSTCFPMIREESHNLSGKGPPCQFVMAVRAVRVRWPCSLLLMVSFFSFSFPFTLNVFCNRFVKCVFEKFVILHLFSHLVIFINY